MANWNSAYKWGIGQATSANDNTLRIGNVSNPDLDWDAVQNLNLLIGGSVGVGTTAPTAGAIFDVNGTGVNYSSLLVPRDMTARRPTTGVNGMIRYNTNLSKFEV